MKCDTVGLFYNLLNEMAMSISYFSEKRKKHDGLLWWILRSLDLKGELKTSELSLLSLHCVLIC